jgi:hypothetical protein
MTSLAAGRVSDGQLCGCISSDHRSRLLRLPLGGFRSSSFSSSLLSPHRPLRERDYRNNVKRQGFLSLNSALYLLTKQMWEEETEFRRIKI